MFRNYIKIAFRLILRNRLFSVINILGLIIGFTAVILIYAWVNQELQYDDFHVKKDNIFRIVNISSTDRGIGNPAPLAPTIQEEIPAIIEASRFREFPKVVFKVDEFFDYESRGYSVDSSFFDIFSFNFLAGNPNEVFPGPFSMVITKKLARKYFGDKNPIGEVIRVENLVDITVTAVIDDVPKNSHFQFDYLLSTKTVEAIGMCGMQWGDFNFKAYVLLEENANSDEVGEQIQQVAMNHECPQALSGHAVFGLQPLNEIYLNPICTWDYPTLGNKNSVLLFSVIGILILVIASFNYINLTTAKSEMRSKEVGIRKIVGAKRIQITKQFVGESLFLALIALNFAIIISNRLFPYLSQLLGKEVNFNFISPNNIAFIIGILIIVGAVAGIYPALLISKTSPINSKQKGFMLLKNKNRSKSLTRKIFVISQFAIAIALITSATFIYKQLKYIQNESWHLKEDIVFHFTVREVIGENYDIIKERLLANPSIKSVSIKNALPTEVNNNTTGVWWDGKDDTHESILFETIRVGYDYFKTMDIKFINGRTFSLDFPADSTTGFIMNEEALRKTGIEDPIGQVLGLYSQKGQIIGIVENTLFQTAKNEQRGQVFHFLRTPANQGYLGSVFVRIDGRIGLNGIQEIVKDIESLWYEINKNTPFEYGFLDDTIYQQYKQEDKLSTLLLYFAFLAIFISSLGMLGLTYYMIENRTKEIGIRKVNGAMPSVISKLIIQDFIKNVLIASVIAWVIAYFFVNQWLQNFVFKTQITPTPFIVATIFALLIAMLTIWVLVIKAANRNPAESLRYE